MKTKLLLAFFLLSALQLPAQLVQQTIYAQVIYLEDYTDIFGGSLQLGDSITGSITYAENATDANTDPTVGDYWYYEPSFGFNLNGPNGLHWMSDTANVEFLVEAVNRQPVEGGDAIVFRSYNNTYSTGDIAADKVMAWQIENPNAANLSSDELPTVINLGTWDQVFALTIEASDFPNGNNYFIRAHVYKISNDISTASAMPVLESHAIYPNPVSGVLTIKHSEGIEEIKISEMNGKELLRQSHPGSALDVSRLAPGIYTVTLSGKNANRMEILVKL
jgi:hypothetical protein